MEWIPCGERLPQVAGEYLVVKNYDGYDKDRRAAEWGFSCDTKAMEWLNPDSGLILDGISHWQQLPDYPEW